MRAFILAAGEGTRLRPLTDSAPKPMISVGGRPILEHNIRLLAAAGVDEIAINLHYKPEAVTSYFGDGRRLGVHIYYSYEERLLGTAGALAPLADRLDSTFFIIYGDNFSTCDLRRLAEFHVRHDAAVTMAIFERPDVTASGIVDLDRNDRITRIIEKPQPDEIFSHWVNAGILVCEPSIFNLIPRDRPSDLSRDVIPALLHDGAPVFGYKMSAAERLWWIDTIEDYRATTEAFTRSGRFDCPAVRSAGCGTSPR
jgi:NDP-sugar pyrophosphorylase family protein